jgi:hypothetical protein
LLLKVIVERKARHTVREVKQEREGSVA